MPELYEYDGSSPYPNTGWMANDPQIAIERETAARLERSTQHAEPRHELEILESEVPLTDGQRARAEGWKSLLGYFGEGCTQEEAESVIRYFDSKRSDRDNN